MKICELLNENDNDHEKALQSTGFQGHQAAGCLFLAQDTKRICIAHRSKYVQEPNTWGTWGGAIDSNETPEFAALREVREEAGYQGKVFKIKPLFVFKHRSGFTYYNFLVVIEHEFRPELNWESQSYGWFDYGDWPSPLHPGLVQLFGDEMSVDIIKKYAGIEDLPTN